MKKRLLFILLLSLSGLAQAEDTPHIKYKINFLDGSKNINNLANIIPLRQNVKEALHAQAEPDQKKMTPEIAAQLFKEAPGTIKTAIEAYGYYTPEITSTPVSPLMTRYDITLGPPMKLSSIQMTITGPGKNEPFLTDLKNNFPLKPGDTLTAEGYNNAIDLLTTSATNHGYLQAHFLTCPNTEKAPCVLYNTASNTAQAIVKFDTGNEFYFGPIDFNKTALSDSFLRRYLSFKEGDPYDPNAITKLQQDLDQSTYFKNITITADVNHPIKNQIPIHVLLALTPSQEYGVGAGFGTATGPRATITTHFNHVGDQGQAINTYLSVSKIIQSLTGEYTIPGADPSKDEYSISSSIARQRPSNNQSTYANVAVGYTTLLPLWQRTLKLTLQRERYQVDNQPMMSSTLLIPSLTYSRLESDDLINPTQGYRITLDLKGGSKTILSSTNFIQAKLSGKALYSFSDDTRILFQGALGLTAVQNPNALPLSLRFFAGGTDSVRGYAYDAIGPGDYLKLIGIELQQRMHGPWFATTFIDAGSAGNSLSSPLKKGVGIGVAYYSIIGPLQLNLARAIDEPTQPFSVALDLGVPL